MENEESEIELIFKQIKSINEKILVINEKLDIIERILKDKGFFA